MLHKTASKLFKHSLFFQPSHRMISRSQPSTSTSSFQKGTIQTPQNLQQMLDFFEVKDAQNNRLCVIHFTAKWNPKCKTVLEQYEAFAAKNNIFTHFVVDTQEQQRIRLYFGARVGSEYLKTNLYAQYQPQFLVLYDGTVADRMIGYDLNRLQTILDSVNENHRNVSKYAPGVENVRQNYFDEHDREATEPEWGRDAFDLCFEHLEKGYLTTK